MKILHINSFFSTGNFYNNLFQEQIKSGFDLNVYIPAKKGFDQKNRDYGDYSIISSVLHRFDRFFFKRKQAILYKDIKSRISLEKIDIIHAHSLFTNGYLALTLKKNFHIPYIVTIRNTDVNVFFKYMIHLRKYGIEVMEQANRLIFLCPKYRDFVIEKYIPEKSQKIFFEKSLIIPNGIDKFWFENKKSNKKKPKEKKVKLLYIGNIDKNKNLLTTLKAIIILHNKGYNIEYTVVGKIRDQFIYNKLKRNSYTTYKKFRPKEKLLEIYEENDIFVMPSKTETFGRVYPEAMSQGLPVIYSKGQGFDGQFPEGMVGFHVNCTHPEDIAEKVECILKNYEQISADSLENVDIFKWELISEQYSNLYFNLKKEKV